MIEWVRRRYPADQGWIVFGEVANSTGWARGFCDAMAMSLWPSRGINLHGFEFKASRTDLVKELAAKDKSERFMKYCDHWWLVVTDLKITEGLEIPATWGILVPKKNALRQHKAAPVLKREAWTDSFMASLMRRCYEQTVGKEVSKRDEEIRNEAAKLAKKITDDQHNREIGHLKRQIEQLTGKLDAAQGSITEFEDKSGIALSPWMAGRIGDAVKLIMDTTTRSRLRRELVNLHRIHSRAAKSMMLSMIALDQMDARERSPVNQGISDDSTG